MDKKVRKSDQTVPLEQGTSSSAGCLLARAAARVPYSVVFMIAVLCGSYCIFLLDRPTISRLTREDGVIESVGAVFFLISAMLFWAAFWRSGGVRLLEGGRRRRTKRDLFYLALSLVFLFAFLEEISWGQRLLNLDSPSMFAEHNRQRETNIHNLEWFHGKDMEGNRKSFWHLLINMDRLFSIFWFALCVCIPVLSTYVPKVRRALTRLRFPILPGVFAILFLGNYVAARLVQLHPGVRTHWAVELKETNIAFLFMCVAMGQLCRTIRRAGRTSAAQESSRGGACEIDEGGIQCNH